MEFKVDARWVRNNTKSADISGRALAQVQFSEKSSLNHEFFEKRPSIKDVQFFRPFFDPPNSNIPFLKTKPSSQK